MIMLVLVGDLMVICCWDISGMFWLIMMCLVVSDVELSVVLVLLLINVVLILSGILVILLVV